MTSLHGVASQYWDGWVGHTNQYVSVVRWVTYDEESP